MSAHSAFTHTDPELLQTLDDLRRREPIFHTAEFGSSSTDYERAMAPGYWEVGASGRRYSRDFILHYMRGKALVSAESLGWQAWDHALRRLGPETFLITYVLRQGERLTRRSTIWERFGGEWRVLYHQGTVVASEGDDIAP